MAHPKTSTPASLSLAHAAASPVAEEIEADAAPDSDAPAAPAPKPASPTRAHPIASPPPPVLNDPALRIEGSPATLRVLVTHGSLRHDGQVYPPDSEAILPADFAKQLEASGSARIIRRPA
jgi:hypothetical protein